MNQRLKKIEMPLNWKLIEAKFIERPNRFLTRVKINNKIVDSHLPDPGRLKELLIPGAKVLIKHEENPKRKTKYSTQAVYLKKQLISINSWLPNQFVEFLLKNQCIDFLGGWHFVRREIPFGKHRFDFLLEKKGIALYIEVKSVTLVEGFIAKFPDAVTERGKQHVQHLNKMAVNNIKTMIIFVVQRSDAKSFQPKWSRDPEFAKALLNAYNNGVLVKVIKADIQKNKIIYCGEIPFKLNQ